MLFTTYTTVAKFLAAQTQGGYGVALIAPSGIILAPYLAVADYPGLAATPVATTGPDACITEGPLALHALVLHSGQLDLDYHHQLPYHPLAA